MAIPPKIDYIYIITYFQKSITYQPLFKTEPNKKISKRKFHCNIITNNVNIILIKHIIENSVTRYEDTSIMLLH